jgi:ribosomal protein S24E
MLPRFGKLTLTGFATIYENAEATKIEPKYVRIRNMPKEKRDEARKAGHKPRKKKKGAD